MRAGFVIARLFALEKWKPCTVILWVFLFFSKPCREIELKLTRKFQL